MHQVVAHPKLLDFSHWRGERLIKFNFHLVCRVHLKRQVQLRHYSEVHVEGPIHDRVFTMGVVGPDGEIIATATGRNKKMAEQEASRLAMDLLQGETERIA